MSRSYLFIPGNVPRMLQNMDIYDADALIIDWEDSISVSEKDEARALTKAYLNKYNPTQDLYIRINNEPALFEIELSLIKTLNIQGVVLPKSDLSNVKKLVNALKDTPLKVIALIESPHAFFELDSIAKIQTVEALFLGGEDLSSALGAKRDASGEALMYARSNLIMAAKAFNKKCIDTPWPSTHEADFNTDLSLASKLGFDAKACIHPNQVIPINEAFSPSLNQLKEAKKIIAMYKKTGKMRFSLDGKMIDKPIISRAQSLLKKAMQYAIIKGEDDDL